MAERLIQYKTISRLVLALKNAASAEKGNIACIDTADGSLVPGAVSTTLVPIGLFEDTLTGDGTTTIGVKLFKEWQCGMFVNASSGPVAAANRMQVCYLHSAFEVSMTATGKSKAGIVIDIVGSGAGAKVYVATELATAL